MNNEPGRGAEYATAYEELYDKYVTLRNTFQGQFDKRQGELLGSLKESASVTTRVKMLKTKYKNLYFTTKSALELAELKIKRLEREVDKPTSS